MSQPLREFVVKLVEMNLFAADFITVSLLLMVRRLARATAANARRASRSRC